MMIEISNKTRGYYITASAKNQYMQTQSLYIIDIYKNAIKKDVTFKATPFLLLFNYF